MGFRHRSGVGSGCCDWLVKTIDGVSRASCMDTLFHSRRGAVMETHLRMYSRPEIRPTLACLQEHSRSQCSFQKFSLLSLLPKRSVFLLIGRPDFHTLVRQGNLLHALSSGISLLRPFLHAPFAGTQNGLHRDHSWCQLAATCIFDA